MYIHVGDNHIVDSNKVIAIFDYEGFSQNKDNVQTLKEAYYNGILENEECELIKSVILMQDNQKEWWIYSNISAKTLYKRLDDYLF